MRLTVFSFVAFLATHMARAAAPDRGVPESPAAPLLREASDIALKQGKDHHFWTDRVLLQIANAQIRAADFDGALKSLRGSHYTWGREHGLSKLAEAFARNGQKDRALETLALIDPTDLNRQARNRRWAEALHVQYLVASSNLEAARKGIEGIEREYAAEALRQLAVAHHKAGDTALAESRFKEAIDAAARIASERERFEQLGAIAADQQKIGALALAKSTIRHLVELPVKDPWTKMWALRDAAELSAKSNDRELASTLYRRCLEAQRTVDDANKYNALQTIAASQARAGFVDDARATAARIEHDKVDWGRDSYREQAFVAVAEACLAIGDADKAVAAAMSVEHFVQYRDDALKLVVDWHSSKRSFPSAFAAAEKFHNPTRRAAAMLSVATEAAKAGDRKAANDFAQRIQLSHRGLLDRDETSFDYRLPKSWIAGYDFDPFVFTISSHMASVRRTAELAGAAMTLTQALGLKHAEPFEESFEDLTYEEVVESLARAHAGTGDVKQATAWARKVGSDMEITSKESRDLWAVCRRIHALIGVAEGILDCAVAARDKLGCLSHGPSTP